MNILAFTGAGISKASGIITYAEVPELRDMLTRTFANEHPEEFKELTEKLHGNMATKEPNDAHLVLAEYGVNIVTMNIDELHEKAGSENVLHIHGTAGKGDIVLYEDSYDNDKWMKMNEMLADCDVLIVVGTSYHVLISAMIQEYGEQFLDEDTFYEINENAEVELRKLLEKING